MIQLRPLVGTNALVNFVRQYYDAGPGVFQYFSGQVGAGGVPSMYEDFTTGQALDPRITFSRTSNATLTGSNGLIQYAPHNLLTYSEQFDNAAWAKSVAGAGVIPVVTANAATAPDGTATADRVQLNCGGTTVSDRSTLSRFGIAIASGVAHVGSVWIRAASTGEVGKQLRFFGDLTLTSIIVTLTNDWQRVSTTGVSSTTSGLFAIETRGTFTTNTTADFYIWGAQLNVGSLQDYNSTTVKNLLGYTQEFDNAAWTKSNVTVTVNATTAPDGSMSADKLVENTATGEHFTNQSATVVGTTPYVISVYAKAAERSRFAVQTTITGTFVRASFDLVAGTVLSTGAGLTAYISNVGNGWYRCSVLATANASVSKSFIFQTVDASGSFNYTGDGTSGIYIWGAQLSDSASVDPYVYNPEAAPSAAAYYGPRFDYDPITLAPKGLLIEEQRTNLMLYSEQFDNAAWVINTSSVTISANVANAPTGTTTADKVIVSSGVAVNTTATYFYQLVTKSASATTYTVTCYAKAAEYNGFRLLVNDNVASVNFAAAAWSLVDGAITEAANVGGTFTSASAGTATDVGGGWYRCSLTFTSSTETTLRVRLYPRNSANVTGDGTSGIYLWGAQLEAGAFATSYIPTVASQVTRSADIAQMLGANFSNWYNQSAGTLVTQMRSVQGYPNIGASVAQDTSNYYNTRNGGTAGTVRTLARTAAAFNINTASSVTTADVVLKQGVAYAAGAVSAARQGSVYVNNVATTLATGMVQMDIGADSINGPYFSNGHVQKISYWPMKLTNAELAALTS